MWCSNHSGADSLPALLTALLFLLGGPAQVFGQALPVGSLEEERLRYQELLHGDSGTGLLHSPVWRNFDTRDSLKDSEQESPSSDWSIRGGMLKEWEDRTFRFDENGSASIYGHSFPFRWGLWNPEMKITTNSRHPQGINSGAAWYGKGVTTEWLGGAYVTTDHLTLSVRPHLIWQQNNDFPEPRFIPLDPAGEPWYTTEGIGDRVDTPFRFGPDPFWTLDPGHSSIRAHYGPMEAGYGTDPLWWGPSLRYPLVMSNNAPGFAHTFLGTRRPVTIPWIGKVQIRWIGGKLAYSDWYHEGLRDLSFDQMDRMGAGANLDRSEQGVSYGEGSDRYLSALHLTWSPALLPDLSLGLIRAVQTPLPDGERRWGDIRAVLDPFQLKRLEETQGGADERTRRYAINSVYARWIWPESHFEIFGEFMRDDYAWDWRDFLMEPHHSSGYSFGFQKLFPTTISGVRWIRSHVEFTNLTASYLSFVRPQGYLYTHEVSPGGHTHKGKLLGAAIGPGSNSQFLQLDALTDWGRVGVYLQRKADNNQFHYEYDQSLGRETPWGDYKRHRTDLTVGLEALWFAGRFALTGKASWTTMMNYGRFDYDHYGPEWGWDAFTWNDLRNVHLQVGMQWMLR